MPTMNRRIGGSFAPPLTPEKLSAYRVVIDRHAPEDLKSALFGLCNMVEAFSQTPESDEPKEPHPVGMGHVQKLEEAEIERMWDLVPWPWEVDALRAAIGRLDLAADSPLRDAAYHLLWYARELAEDREPCTNDKLG